MNTTASIQTRTIRKVTQNDISTEEDFLAIEEPLEISISYSENGKKIKKNISVTMRTPSNDEELALGFLFTEGIIRHFNQVKSVNSNILDPNKVLVTLHDNEVPVLHATERNFYTTSSCGVCGKASIDAIKTTSQYSISGSSTKLPQELFYNIFQEIKNKQEVFEQTGGLHASFLFDQNGHFVMLREDVGRHNALDKLIGAALMNDTLPLSNSMLLLSGRASFELIQKAKMAGIGIVAAIGAPSSLAAQLAEECGMTLIGFLRKDRFNLYSGFERINDI